MKRQVIKSSPAKRWSKAAFWTAVVVVVTLRLIFQAERVHRIGMALEDLGHGGRARRLLSRVQPPVSPVPTNLWRIHIEIEPGDVKLLRGYRWNGWPGNNQIRPEVTARVREGDTVYTNVALHLKGAAGSFQPFDSKPALTLNFSKHASGQKFHGFSKISLNNSVQDSTFLNEAISRELFEAAGVPVPRSDHATVLINGRDLGLYVLTEGWGKPFLKRYFKDVGGNLYDGGFIQDISDDLAVNSGDRQEDRSDLKRLEEAALVLSSTNRWERLGQVLDTERFISLLAMEVMTCHWDGYAMNRNNFRVFHDRDTDRMVFMPHGLDQMFGSGNSGPTSSILPPMQGMVARAVISTPEGRRLFLDRIASLRTGIFLEERLTNRVQELARRIRPTLAAYGPDLAEEHDHQVADFCRRIEERARSISEQLAAPRESVRFDEAGVAQLSGWAPRVTSGDRSRLHFERIEDDGRKILQIAAHGGGGVGSWRVRAQLEAGRYRFEGNARTVGVRSGGGVCLRISGARNALLRGNDNEWTQLTFEIPIEELQKEVELICELKAPAGEAWFDEASLRLVRE